MKIKMKINFKLYYIWLLIILVFLFLGVILTLYSNQKTFLIAGFTSNLKEGLSIAKYEDVEIKQLKYLSSEVWVYPGQTVRWTNMDSVSHTVTHISVDDQIKLFDSGILEKGESFEYQFNEIGKYSYFCTLHPFMNGVVKVILRTPENMEKRRIFMDNLSK